MEIFNKPKNLNGTELKAQLAEVGIIVDEIFDFADGTIGFNTDNKTAAELVVKGHNGTITAIEPTVQEKLASVGLNLNDLKEALGIA